ncbi:MULTISPECIES: hypothetical protein [Virgibacillus]|uniref:hypothetical protein n=1 Tax=Virgibacillus TaxID=84406 RepID=UPI00038835FA|nr:MULTISPECIES: hypothetical protein [Virgibacillus]EQB34755.1 hypothetical protein M948_20415 [Virgibacillus sp. CM-4]MYL43608.1 hypothetical protein [Virgibacillus massiliensis]
MKFKKVMIIGVLGMILSIPTVAFAYTEPYTFTFEKQLTSDWFYLDPIDHTVYVENTSNAYGGNPTSNLYYVDVISEDGWGGKLKGTATFLRDGSSKRGVVVSSSAGQQYTLKFRKSNDGETVDGYGRAYDGR